MLTRTASTNNATTRYFRKNAEVTYQCPTCFAMETLFFEGGRLIKTRLWTQLEGNIYHHNCGRPSQPFASSKVLLLSNNTDYILSKIAFEKQKRLSKLASEIGVNRMTVKRWLAGKCYPNNESKKKLCSYAGGSESDL